MKRIGHLLFFYRLERSYRLFNLNGGGRRYFGFRFYRFAISFWF